MTEKRIIDALRQMRFSSGLSEEDLDKLAQISEWVRFEPGAVIFSEGQIADEVYLIVDGRVELSMSIPEKGMLPILTLEFGDLLGGSPVLSRGEMSMTAMAKLETAAIKINATRLRKLCEDDHDIGYEIMRRVAHALLNRLVATRLQVLDVHGDALNSPLMSSPSPSPGEGNE